MTDFRTEIANCDKETGRRATANTRWTVTNILAATRMTIILLGLSFISAVKGILEYHETFTLPLAKLVYRNINMFTFILLSFIMLVVDRYSGTTMSRETKKPVLVLDEAQTGKLKSLAGSRTTLARDVERAQILLAYA